MHVEKNIFPQIVVIQFVIINLQLELKTRKCHIFIMQKKDKCKYYKEITDFL